jgi:hypothetical protein
MTSRHACPSVGPALGVAGRRPNPSSGRRLPARAPWPELANVAGSRYFVGHDTQEAAGP